MPRQWPEHSGDDERAWELALRGERNRLRARDSARAAAFLFASRGAELEAVRALDARGASEISFPVVLALDLARIRLLAGHPEGAVVALQVGLRGAAHVPPAGRRLLAACVAEAPWLRRSALRVVVGSGTVGDRLAGLAAVLTAR